MKKKIYLFLAFLTMFMGANAANWVQVTELHFGQFTSFPYYVMGYVPEFYGDGLMTDLGGQYSYKTDDEMSTYEFKEGEKEVGTVSVNGVTYHKIKVPGGTWHQYFVLGGFYTQVGGHYKVVAKVKASEACDIPMQMRWSWNEGAYVNTSASAGTNWAEIEWEYSEIGGNQCDLIAQPNTAAQIQWEWIKVYEDRKEQSSITWQEWLTSDGTPTGKYMGNAETPWPNPNCSYNDQTQNYLICAWSKTNAGTPFPSPIEYVDGSKVFVVHGTACADPNDVASAWDNQFFIQSPKAWKSGETVKIHFRYKASKNVTVGTQVHRQNPGDYCHYEAIGDINFTTGWQVFDQEMRINGSMDGCWSIAFNLNNNDKNAIDFYFDDLSWQSMKLDEGYFVAGSDPQGGLDYDFDNAVQFEDGVGADGSPCLVATIGSKGAYVSQVMISTVRGNDAAFKSNTIKPNGTITNDPSDWKDYTREMNAKLTLPSLGIWKIYLDPSYGSIAFELIESQDIVKPEIEPNPTEIVVHAQERDDLSDLDGVVREEEGGTGEVWDNQFFIVANRTLSAGEEVTVSFKYRSSIPARVSTQCHRAPGAYLHWAAIGDVNFETYWQQFESTFTVASEANGMQTIAFNMAEIKSACDYYIKDVVWKLSDGSESLINQTGSENYQMNICEPHTSVSQSLALTTLPSKTYGDAAITLPQTTKEGLTLTWKSSNTAVATVSGNVLTVRNAGTATITASQAGNYTYLPFSREFTFTVNKASLTITADNQTKKQGEANPTFTVRYSGFKNGENYSVLTKKPTVTCSATTSSPAGTYPITVSGAEAQNYNISYINGTLTVTAADAVIVTAKDYTITYGDALPTFEYTVSGGTYNGTPKITCSATSSSDAGTYDINIAAGSGTNYNVTYVKGTLTIKKATLTASVGNYTRKQGEANPTFTISYSGFKKNQTKSVLTREPTASCSATPSSAPGSYPITLSGGEAKNYEFNYQTGILTVEQRDAVTITANSYTIEYGDPLPNFGYTTTGVALSGTPTVSCAATSSSNAGTYTITVGKGSVSNEEATFVNGTLTIRKATLTASVGSYTKKQGDAIPTFSISYSGFKNGETKSVLTREPTASCSATASSAPGSYPITLSGGQATNYEFNYQNGTLTVIAADAAAVTARSYTITYGDPLPQFEYDTSGVTLNGTPAISCSATANSDAGTYDIVVSKGSVSNYNVSYVNGTLTIKKAVLTASVGEYTRKPGEDNPKFTISYTGFKKNQTKSVLTSEPTARCTATKDSPSGTYPITLSGGSAKNYDFKYENGVLKVLNGYTLSIMSIGKGTTSFGAQTISQNNSINTTVYAGEEYTVTFKPEKGYKLGRLLLNDKNVIAEVINNTYKISNVSQTSTLIAMYEESLGEFTAGGITYEILSGSENTVAVTRGNYTGHIEIPATVSDNGIKWNVVGIQDNAFNSRSELLTIALPSSLKEDNTGISLFTGCSALASIKWEASFPMTNMIMGGITNPNLLFYTKNAAYAPSSVKNVVVNGTADEITLTDAGGSNNFYCPTEFTARKISYTHNYTMTSGFGGKAQGWETIALPFDVKEIRHASKGTVLPFAAWSNSSSAKPFWLCSLSSGGFSRASSIQANTPYIICMPNNEEYDADYILSGAVTFSATNAKVKASSSVSNGKSGTKTFVPAFCAQEKSSKVYALNVNNDIHSERGGYDEGSRFVSNLRTVSPFEAYMTDSSAGAKLTIDIEFSDATGIDELTGDRDNGTSVYTIMGQKVKDSRLKNGTLPQGIYIKNGRKVSIRK